MLNNLLSDYQFKLFGSDIETGVFVLILGMLVIFERMERESEWSARLAVIVLSWLSSQEGGSM